MAGLRSLLLMVFVGGLLILPLDAVAATLTFAEGQLTGASEVMISGVSYDVVFRDGTFDDIFASTSLDFTTGEAANAASNALMQQVYIQGSPQDLLPDLTFGISATNYGVIWTPYMTFSYSGVNYVEASFFVNSNAAGSYGTDRVGLGAINMGYDHSTISQWVWADWSMHVDNPGPDSGPAPVPEPSTLILLGSGIGGLLAYKKKRRN